MKAVIIIYVLLWGITNYGCSQTSNSKIMISKSYPRALVNYDDFKALVSEVETHRQNRLVDLDTFLKLSTEDNVIVFDARSAFRFTRKHLKGTVNLSFPDFTQANLAKIVPDTTTKILIYCNNNFDGDQVDFASKIAKPAGNIETQILSNRKPLMLALNVPTYITLYGYGYRNIYELDELINVNDKRILFEGTEVRK